MLPVFFDLGLDDGWPFIGMTVHTSTFIGMTVERLKNRGHEHWVPVMVRSAQRKRTGVEKRLQWIMTENGRCLLQRTGTCSWTYVCNVVCARLAALLLEPHGYVYVYIYIYIYICAHIPFQTATKTWPTTLPEKKCFVDICLRFILDWPLKPCVCLIPATPCYTGACNVAATFGCSVQNVVCFLVAVLCTHLPKFCSQCDELCENYKNQT